MPRGRFYVYRVFDDDGTVYVGKGTGRRAKLSAVRFGADHEIIAWCRSEDDAFQREQKAIEEMAPRENKNRGGAGGRCRKAPRRRFRWEVEIEREGSRRYCAKFLLSRDLRSVIPPSEVEGFRQRLQEVVDGPRV